MGELVLYQPEKGYCYTSDTFFLYDFISDFIPKGRILEVGGGCGILGLLIKRDYPETEVTIVEREGIMVQFIRKNSYQNRLYIKVVEGDFLKVPLPGRFDFIISNPPYHPTGVKSSNPLRDVALSQTYLPLDRFLNRANRLLTERGELIFCYGVGELDKIFQLMPKQLKITDLRIFYPRLNKKGSLALIRAKRLSKARLKIHPPLIGFVGEEYSSEVAQIYRRANTRSIKIGIEELEKG